MKAKVMSPKKIADTLDENRTRDLLLPLTRFLSPAELADAKALCKAQDKISYKIGYDQALKDIERLIKQARAEGFKAGQEEEAKGGHNTISFLEGRKAGMKEVAEFIDDLIIGVEGCEFEERLDGDKGCIVLDMNENQWQAKKKEWGKR
ncbi:hypothetical protein LCGC14_0514420 [marine sediment metagenome]|uniref:Uncharacterized protein n=1 Tax=marine sediment metagenome TaxID=412755 RepID=A0A0F9V8F5_9ZZZZ